MIACNYKPERAPAPALSPQATRCHRHPRVRAHSVQASAGLNVPLEETVAGFTPPRHSLGINEYIFLNGGSPAGKIPKSFLDFATSARRPPGAPALPPSQVRAPGSASAGDALAPTKSMQMRREQSKFKLNCLRVHWTGIKRCAGNYFSLSSAVAN